MVDWGNFFKLAILPAPQQYFFVMMKHHHILLLLFQKVFKDHCNALFWGLTSALLCTEFQCFSGWWTSQTPYRFLLVPTYPSFPLSCSIPLSEICLEKQFQIHFFAYQNFYTQLHCWKKLSHCNLEDYFHFGLLSWSLPFTTVWKTFVPSVFGILHFDENILHVHWYIVPNLLHYRMCTVCVIQKSFTYITECVQYVWSKSHLLTLQNVYSMCNPKVIYLHYRMCTECVIQKTFTYITECVQNV